MNEFNFRVPGEQDGPVFTDKQILVHADYHILDRFSITIAPNTGDLDKGTILGVTTADSMYRPVRRSALTVISAASDTTIDVVDGSKFKVGDAVSLIKADGTGLDDVGVVSGVNVNTVTVSVAAAAGFAVGDFLFVKDGSEKALVVLGDPVLDSTTQNRIGNAYVAGKFYLSKLVGCDAFVQKDLSARVIPFGLDPETGAAESILIV